MEIKINKEVSAFKEVIFWGLTLRQFICAVVAIITAVGLYFLLIDYLGSEITSWVCIAGALPPALIGFFHYHGLPFEKFLVSWLRTNFRLPRRLHFKARNELMVALREKPKKQRKGNRKHHV